MKIVKKKVVKKSPSSSNKVGVVKKTVKKTTQPPKKVVGKKKAGIHQYTARADYAKKHNMTIVKAGRILDNKAKDKAKRMKNKKNN